MKARKPTTRSASAKATPAARKRHRLGGRLGSGIKHRFTGEDIPAHLVPTPADELLRRLIDRTEAYAHASSGSVVVVTTMTPGEFDALCAFEADLEDTERNGDDEPSAGTSTDDECEPTIGATDALNQDQWGEHQTCQFTDGAEQDQADEEPSLGSVDLHGSIGSQEDWAQGNGLDLEQHDEAEPSLGSADRDPDQSHWGSYSYSDLEDEANEEPSLGSTQMLNQTRWADGFHGGDDERDPAEHEPSLGFVNTPGIGWVGEPVTDRESERLGAFDTDNSADAEDGHRNAPRHGAPEREWRP
jgi:hypothetical protein